jgi:hypothetical protein
MSQAGWGPPAGSPGPGRIPRPQGGSAHDGLTLGVHVLFAQESRVRVRGRNGLGDDGECLLRKGVQGLLGGLGSYEARLG